MSLRGNAQRASDLRRQRAVADRTEKNESYQAAKAAALARLRDSIKPEQRVYTILDHVNRSLTQRQIKVVVLAIVDGEPIAISATADVALVLGYPMSRNGHSLHVRGGGTDMGFQIVTQLARVLWPDRGQYLLNHSWL